MAKAARRNPEVHYENMNVMGFSEVFRKLPCLIKNLRTAKKVIKEFHPDVLILVDYPSFNLKLAKYAHGLGIKVGYFISPKCGRGRNTGLNQLRDMSIISILYFRLKSGSIIGTAIR